MDIASTVYKVQSIYMHRRNLADFNLVVVKDLRTANVLTMQTVYHNII